MYASLNNMMDDGDGENLCMNKDEDVLVMI